MRSLSTSEHGARFSALACLVVALLATGCPQDIGSAADGGTPAGAPDAGYSVPVCRKPGPDLRCTLAGAESDLAVDSILTIDCVVEQAHGRPIVFEGPRTSFAGMSTDRSFGASSGTAHVQLRHELVGVGFPDTVIHIDLGARWEDDPEACTWQSFETRWVGNLWVADPIKGGVSVVASCGHVLQDVLPLEGIRRPRLLAKVHDGVLAGGSDDANRTVLSVYAPSGERLRGPLDFAGQLGTKPLPSAAEGLAGLYVTTGTGEHDGELFLYTGEGQATKISVLGGQLPRGVAPLAGGGVAVGLVDAAGAFAVLDPANPSGRRIAPMYAADWDCAVDSAFAVLPISQGRYWLSVRERLDATSYGMAVLLASDYGILSRTPPLHDPPTRDGLFLKPHDWQAEVRPGVLVGTRNDSTAVELLDSSLRRSGEWGTLGPSAAPRGLLRLQ